MGAVDGDVMGQELLIHGPVIGIGPQRFQAVEDDRMVADDQFHALFDGVVDGVHHDVQGHQHLIDGFIGISDEQARIVPRLFKF